MKYHHTSQRLTLDVSSLLLEITGQTYAPALCPGKLRGRIERCVRGRLLHNVLLPRGSVVLDELSLRLHKQRFNK